MRIGILARSDATGLGIQSKEFYDHIQCKALVLDLSAYTSLPKQNLDWFPNQTIVKIDHIKNGCIPTETIMEFIKDIDILVTFETAYDYNIFSLCRQRNIKTVLQLNYEFLDYPSYLPMPDLFLAPSMWHWNDIPEQKIFLQVPVNINHSIPQRKGNTFIHIVGRPAIHNRNGTDTLMQSLKHIQSNIKLIIRSQHKLDFRAMTNYIPNNIDLIIDADEKNNYADNYSGGVLVLPRKYGGLCLPCQEAIAAGMPVIMPDISPNNTWLPNEWLVPANKVSSFRCKKEIDIYETNNLLLAEKIDFFCEPGFYENGIIECNKIKELISWESLREKYYTVFESLYAN